MKHGKIVGVSLVAIVAAGSLASCSTDGGSSSGGIELTVWHNTADTDAVLSIYEDYEKATGNTINLVDITSDGFEEATLTKWATGDRPDILEYHGFTAGIDQLGGGQNFISLEGMPFIEASGGLYDVAGRGSDGNVYAAITSFPEVWGLFYNKQVLADNGLEPATTQAELVEQCKVLSAAGIPTIAESGGSSWPPQAIPLMESASLAPAGWSQDVLDKKTTIDADDSPMLAGIQAFEDLLDDGCMNEDITTTTFEAAVSKVYTGEAAYQPLHSNIINVYVDAAGGDNELLGQTVGFSALGADEPTVAVNPGPIGTFLVPKTGDSAKEEAAKEFIEFVTGEHYATYVKDSGTFPVIEGVDDPTDVSPLLLEVKAAYDSGKQVGFINGNVPGGMQGQAALLSELIAGQKSAKDVASALQSQLATAAKAQGLSGW